MSCEESLKSCSNCNVELRQKYINAVLNIDVEGLEHLLKTEPFEREMLDRLLPSCPKGCSILWIIQCWEIILAHPKEWNEEFQGKVIQRQKRNLEIKRIFEDKLQAKFIPVDFQKSPFHFFRSEEDESVEDILDKSREELNDMGFRDLDIDLYCAVDKFDFGETERLLREGANPNVLVDDVFDDEVDMNCLNRVGMELGFLEVTQLQNLILGDEYVTSDYYRYLTDLVGLAAHKKMYSLLLEYDKDYKDLSRKDENYN